MLRRRFIVVAPARVHDIENNLGPPTQVQVAPRPWKRKLVCLLIVYVLSWTFLLEAMNESRRLRAERIDYELRGPPPGCAGTEQPKQSWGNWFMGRPVFDEQTCREYNRVLSQSTWPNLLRVAIQCICDCFVLPLERVLRSLAAFLASIHVLSGTLLLLLAIFVLYHSARNRRQAHEFEQWYSAITRDGSEMV